MPFFFYYRSQSRKVEGSRYIRRLAVFLPTVHVFFKKKTQKVETSPSLNEHGKIFGTVKYTCLDNVLFREKTHLLIIPQVIIIRTIRSKMATIDQEIN